MSKFFSAGLLVFAFCFGWLAVRSQDRNSTEIVVSAANAELISQSVATVEVQIKNCSSESFRVIGVKSQCDCGTATNLPVTIRGGSDATLDFIVELEGSDRNQPTTLGGWLLLDRERNNVVQYTFEFGPLTSIPPTDHGKSVLERM